VQLSTKDRRVIRTVLQVVVGLAAAVPIVLPALGIPTTLAGYGIITGVAAGITRIMALDAVEQALDKVGIGLDGTEAAE
jgi:K+-transporting ATPase A subunit